MGLGPRVLGVWGLRCLLFGVFRVQGIHMLQVTALWTSEDFIRFKLTHVLCWCGITEVISTPVLQALGFSGFP